MLTGPVTHRPRPARSDVVRTTTVCIGPLEILEWRSARGRSPLGAEVRVDALEQLAAEAVQRRAPPRASQPLICGSRSTTAKRITVRSPSPPGVSVQMLTHA